MKIKTSELTGVALNWAVAKCEGCSENRLSDVAMWSHIHQQGAFRFATDWSAAGPIIEREGIELICNLTATEAARFKEAHADWQAFYRDKRSTEDRSFAVTPLLAAMRCYVARKLGDQVDIPETLT